MTDRKKSSRNNDLTERNIQLFNYFSGLTNRLVKGLVKTAKIVIFIEGRTVKG